MSERVPGEEDILKLVVDEFCRGVVITLDFIADNLNLFLDLMLGILTVEDNVGKHIDSL